MTYDEFKEFQSYNCNYDCENCEYRSWLGYDFGCIVDTVKDVGDLITED